ncbi:hypothetical protein Q767_08105 [Flavobacterium enshiense DK69]|uniref:Uncharacterized protein n=1 Tax=Flavobacterium enshiense DK69 TaxID=1107311 RepID=A0A0A2MV60_9FLAO|nr:hypothetical protein Q767_08105 [Flavobacterium enshiense DK69]
MNSNKYLSIFAEIKSPFHEKNVNQKNRLLLTNDRNDHQFHQLYRITSPSSYSEKNTAGASEKDDGFEKCQALRTRSQ